MYALHDFTAQSCTTEAVGTSEYLESDLESTERPSTGSSLFGTRAGKSKVGTLVRYSQNIQCIFSSSSKTISFTDVEIDVWLAMIKKWMKWFEVFPAKHQKTKLVEQMIRIHDAKMWEGSGTSDFTMAVWGNIS